MERLISKLGHVKSGSGILFVNHGERTMDGGNRCLKISRKEKYQTQSDKVMQVCHRIQNKLSSLTFFFN